VLSPADAHAIVRSFIGDSDREHFVVLLLDTRNRAIGVNTVSIGNLNANLVHPREVFKPALLANVASILIAHNHPSGDCEPSAEDFAITERLKQAGELLGVPVVDHLVLGEPGFYSFKEHGTLRGAGKEGPKCQNRQTLRAQR
jgi:DNA repair protein RadC